MTTRRSKPDSTARKPLIAAVHILFGAAVTVCIYGYRYGEGNHTIYLLDALRGTDPQTLRNDWFATQTLQYHAVYGWMARRLMQWNVIEPAFRIGYFLLILLFQVAWLGIARRVSAHRATYVVSLAMFYASAAGTGLGFYQFFQDSSLLPSNIANVALLWGIYLWLSGRVVGSGVCFGLAGLFHLNFAVVGSGLWVIVNLWGTQSTARGRWSRVVWASLLALLPSLINIGIAAREKLAGSGSMPISEFVDLYVRLRHPHHYDPASWPIWLWVAFFWSIPLALLFARSHRNEITRRALQVLLSLGLLQIVALLGAGIWFVSETLVQLSLYRFSIFIQLLGCIMSAAWVVEQVRRRAGLELLALGACAGMIVACLLRGPFFGMFEMPEDGAEYRELCDWARRNTPIHAIFLVPPGESGFRLHAQRAIVVNFKAVPQLSAELHGWRDRMRDVLALDDLNRLPRGYGRTLAAIDEQYSALSMEQHIATARKHRARYIVVRGLPAVQDDLEQVFSTASGRYSLYDLGTAPGGR